MDLLRCSLVSVSINKIVNVKKKLRLLFNKNKIPISFDKDIVIYFYRISF